MIIAQKIKIDKKKIALIVSLFKEKGYEISNYQSDILDGIVFDAYDVKFDSIFRFQCNSIGDITGLITIDADDVGLYDVLLIIYPFVDQDGYIFITGEHQCELEGYYIKADGLYEATNIVVQGDLSHKIELGK